MSNGPPLQASIADIISQATIDQYREQGFTLITGLFTEQELNALESAFDSILARRLAIHENLDATWKGEWRDQVSKTPTQILHTHDPQAYDATFSRLLTHDRLTEAFTLLMGTPNLQLHHVKMFQKPGERGSAFPMHQDQPYFPHEQHTMTAGIIHLTDATEEMGCVRFYPGSHNLGPLPCFELRHLNPAEWPLERATPTPARRGDVAFFNYLTVHGSDINRSQHIRKTVLMQVRDPQDRPLSDDHRSQAQGMILRGIHPLEHGITAWGTLDELPSPAMTKS